MARLTFGSAAPLVYPGSASIPAVLLERVVGLTPALASAPGFLGLSLGLPGNAPLLRMVALGGGDPWALGGHLRALTALVAFLVQRGRGVILPQAGMALDRDAFLRRVGDLRDPANRPFLAWASLAYDDSVPAYRSRGLAALELFDVVADAQLPAPAPADATGTPTSTPTRPAPGRALALHRAKDAVLYACHRMVRDGRSLEPGSVLGVPVGIRLAHGAPIDLAGVDLEPYRVTESERGLALTPLAPHTALAAGWARGDTIASFTYEALFRAAAEDWHRGAFAGDISLPERDGAPELVVEVHRVQGGAILHTVGAGRVAQPGGDVKAGTAFLELVALVGADHPFLARVLGVVAQALHQHPPESPFQFGDTVSLAVEEIGAAGFVLRDAGSLSLGAGEPVSIMELVPLTAEELDRCRRQGSGGFLQELGPMSLATRAPRWVLRPAR